MFNNGNKMRVIFATISLIMIICMILVLIVAYLV